MTASSARRDRQYDAESRLHGVAALDNQLAEVALRNPTCDRPSPSRTVAPARRIELHETLEHSCPIFDRNAQSGVLHTQRNLLSVAAQINRDDPAPRRVLHRVLQDIENELSEQILVAAIGSLLKLIR